MEEGPMSGTSASVIKSQSETITAVEHSAATNPIRLFEHRTIESFFNLTPSCPSILLPTPIKIKGEAYKLGTPRSATFSYDVLVKSSKTWLMVKLRDHFGHAIDDFIMDDAMGLLDYNLKELPKSLKVLKHITLFELVKEYEFVDIDNLEILEVPLGQPFDNSLTRYQKITSDGKLVQKCILLASLHVLPTLDFSEYLVSGFASKFFNNGTPLWITDPSMKTSMNFAMFKAANSRNNTYVNYIMTYVLGFQHDLLYTFTEPTCQVPGSRVVEFNDFTCLAYVIACRFNTLVKIHHYEDKVARLINMIYFHGGALNRVPIMTMIKYLKVNLLLVLATMSIDHALPSTTFESYKTSLKTLTMSSSKSAAKT